MKGEERLYFRKASLALATAAMGLFAVGTLARAGDVVGWVIQETGTAQIQRPARRWRRTMERRSSYTIG